MSGMCLIIDKQKRAHASCDNLNKMLGLLSTSKNDINGIWTNEEHSLGFGESLSLVHESPLPLWNTTKDIALIITGRIYNAYELRVILESRGHHFQSMLDAEVILHGYEMFGTEILRKIEGMFALTIIDFRAQQIVMARDGFGKKPLYYFENEDFFTIATEMQCMLQGIPGPGSWTCDYNGLSDYLVFGHNVRERTIVKNVKRVLPGEVVLISFTGEVINRWRYWILPSVNPFFHGGADEAYEQFKLRFENAVIRHFENTTSQVDILVSGGVDSVALLCAATELGFQPNIFTLSVKGQENDGSKNVQILAEKFNLNITIRELEGSASTSDFIEAMNCFDEPFCSPNALGLALIGQTLSEAKRTAAVLGDGGNELMLGFQHFHDYAAGRLGQAYGLASNCNDFLRNISTMHNLSANWAHHFCEQMSRVPTPLRRKLFDDSFSVLNDATVYTIFDTMFDQQGRSPYDFLARFDYLFELPDEIMLRIDRMSARSNCEFRTPYIDRDLASFMVSLPEELHFGMGKDIKWMLHRYIHDTLKDPALVESVINSRRQGFPLPMEGIMKALWEDGMAQWLLEDDFLWWTSLRREGVEEVMSKKNNKNGISRATLTLFSLYLWWRKVICARPVKLD